MELKSQISTSIEQSKKLLELGLKPETADMLRANNDRVSLGALPSWSLSRLIELMPEEIEARREKCWLQFSIENNGVAYKSRAKDYLIVYYDETNNDNDLFENFISMIGYLIRKKYFNKEYLCAKK